MEVVGQGGGGWPPTHPQPVATEQNSTLFLIKAEWIGVNSTGGIVGIVSC